MEDFNYAAMTTNFHINLPLRLSRDVKLLSPEKSNPPAITGKRKFRLRYIIVAPAPTITNPDQRVTAPKLDPYVSRTPQAPTWHVALQEFPHEAA